MSELIDRLEIEAKKKGLTFNRIERELGLGNGTIKRWNDQSPRLDKLTAVARFVGVSLDYLVFGELQTESTPNRELDLARVKEEQGLLCDGSPLSSLETDLVAMFRLLPEEEREDVFDIVHLKYKRRIGKRRSLSTGHISTRATNKAAPPKAVRPATEPPDFLRLYD